MNPAVASPAVHHKSSSGQPLKTLTRQMFATCHPPNDVGESHELFLLAAQKRVPFEERDNFLEKSRPLAHDVHECTIPHRVAMILPHRSTFKTLPDEVQYPHPGDILTYSELGH